ncbi:hypothetical protein KKP06_21985 [Ralstonia pickettii]|uniref:hypothetical protein n=1 Tax=Ralstonia pickettii TaxID=329 RepID=UPI001BE49383|nr:hypothetical protein [Ralstonia pickettii]MBT2180489.1 hypothetical protein [Ralstonia pickettii]
MRRIFAGFVAALISISALAQTYDVNNLNVHGNVAFTTPTQPAGAIQYLQGASGSAARSITSKFQDSISSADFAGCDPTGVADSTTCLQNAILAGANKLLFIAPGNYKVTSLNVSSPIWIFTGGAGSVTFTETAATGDMFTVSANDVYITGLGFASSVTRTAGAYVNFTSSTNRVVLRDFFMTGAYLGVHLTCAAECRIEDGTIFGGATTAGSAGILVDGGNDQYINKITMDAPAGSQPAAGIQVVQTGALNITDSDIIHHTADLLINPGSGQSVASLYALNTYFDTAVRGVSIAPTGTGIVLRLHFIGCWTSSHTDTGFFVSSASTGALSGIELIGHHAILNAGSGALFNNGTTNPDSVKVIGGDFAGNGQNGIAFGAGVSNFIVEGAHSGAYVGQSGNGAWGLLVAAGASNNYIINGNLMVGNTTGSISDGGTGSSRRVTNNLPAAPAQSVPTVGASPWTYTNSTATYQTAYVNGGTVSVVAVAGSNVFTQTNCTVRIPPGQTMTITYSAAPGVGITSD